METDLIKIIKETFRYINLKFTENLVPDQIVSLEDFVIEKPVAIGYDEKSQTLVIKNTNGKTVGITQDSLNVFGPVETVNLLIEIKRKIEAN